jgi:hypothetical protein
LSGCPRRAVVCGLEVRVHTRPWLMLCFAALVLAAIAVNANGTESYDTYLIIEPGSVWCRQGISGPGGDELSYAAWVTDPGGATLREDNRSTTNWRLDGSYSAYLTYSGTYTCWAYFL